jgi:ATP citrate (pro-S)-lyase
VKPDQLIKRRGKLGLIKVDVDLNGVREWLADKISDEVEIGAAKGKLTNFIIEPFVKHEPSEEFYVRYVHVHIIICKVSCAEDSDHDINIL